MLLINRSKHYKLVYPCYSYYKFPSFFYPFSYQVPSHVKTKFIYGFNSLPLRPTPTPLHQYKSQNCINPLLQVRSLRRDMPYERFATESKMIPSYQYLLTSRTLLKTYHTCPNTNMNVSQNVIMMLATQKSIGTSMTFYQLCWKDFLIPFKLCLGKPKAYQSVRKIYICGIELLTQWEYHAMLYTLTRHVIYVHDMPKYAFPCNQRDNHCNHM